MKRGVRPIYLFIYYESRTKSTFTCYILYDITSQVNSGIISDEMLQLFGTIRQLDGAWDCCSVHGPVTLIWVRLGSTSIACYQSFMNSLLINRFFCTTLRYKSFLRGHISVYKQNIVHQNQLNTVTHPSTNRARCRETWRYHNAERALEDKRSVIVKRLGEVPPCVTRVTVEYDTKTRLTMSCGTASNVIDVYRFVVWVKAIPRPSIAV